MLQHTGEEELACHCHQRPRGGGAHGSCRGGSRSRAHRARKPGADVESTFETLNATWICNLKEQFGSVDSCEPFDATWMARRASSAYSAAFFLRSVELLSQITDPNYTTSTNVLGTVGTRRYEQ